MEQQTVIEPSSADLEQAVGAASTDELVDDVTRYVVVNINHNHYGISTESTVELMSSAVAHVTRVPHSPKFISGVINHRGTIIPVVDMRALLGFEPQTAEADKLKAMFEKLKNDHIGWLNALQDAIYTTNPFSKATDPTKCAFGKWYLSVMDGTSPMSAMVQDDPILKNLFDRFDVPHRNIHGIAPKALLYKEEGDVEKAIELIDRARDTDLAEMIELFDLVFKGVSASLDSMMVITEIGSRKAAIAVDAVSFVVDCVDESIEPLPDTADNTEFLSGLVHQDDGTYILIADLQHIYNIACPQE